MRELELSELEEVSGGNWALVGAVGLGALIAGGSAWASGGSRSAIVGSAVLGGLAGATLVAATMSTGAISIAFRIESAELSFASNLAGSYDTSHTGGSKVPPPEIVDTEK